MNTRESIPEKNGYGRIRQRKYAIIPFILGLFFLFGVTTQVHAQQRVTITFENEPLANALKQLSKESGYKINFSTEDVQNHKVSATLRNAAINDAMRVVLEKTPFTYERNGNLISVIKREQRRQASSYKIQGQVVDKQKMPLIGVNIRATDNVGTITDVDGNFTLNVAPNHTYTLTFSYIGMRTEKQTVKMESQDITMKQVVMEEDNAQMGEVVVTGIFNKARESYTGAATSYTQKQLQEAGNRSLASTLRNLDASFNIADNIGIGSDPNSLPTITIRGSSSLPTDVKDMQVSADNQRTANQPLFILDGFEITLTRFMDLDESQVENVTLLKDANATALYGSKGSNGVVVITSKRIEPGKLRFSYKGTLNIEAADLSSYNLMNASEKLQFEKLAGLYDVPGNPIQDKELKDLYNKRKLDVERGVNTYWLKYPVRTGIGSRHYASIEGGDESLRYGASLSYNNVAGAMKGSERNTLTGDMFLLYKYQNFTFQNRLQITNNQSENSPYGSFSQYCTANSYFTPYDEEGNLIKRLENYYYNSTNTTNKVYNPLYNAMLPNKNTSEYTEITNNFSAQWDILPELFVRGQFSVTKRTKRSDNFLSPSNTEFDDFTGDDYQRKGRYTYGSGHDLDYSGQFTLNYTKTFADKHQVFGGLGATIEQKKSELYSITGEGISVENMDFLGMASQYLKDGRPTGSEATTRDVGILFNFRYVYDQRYFVDFNGKYDGSSQFGSNNHFSPFWSTGAGWNLHHEAFMQNQHIVDVARLRLSYGITGSQNFPSYLGIRTYQDFGGQSTEGWYGAYLLAYGNPDLKWQKTSQINFGTDIELLNRRVQFGLDIYNKITDDLLADVNLPLSSGFANYKANIGKTENRGWELNLSGQIIRDVENDLRWTVGVKAAHNSNKIKEISNSLQTLNDELSNQDKYTPSFLYKEGESMKTIYAVRSKGIDPSNGKEIFIKADGTETYTWDAKDQVACGVDEPKVMGTINTNVRWKGISVNLIFGYRWGGKSYNSTLANKVENIKPYQNADRRVLYDRWKEPGDVATFKGVRDNTKTYATSRFIFKDNAFYASSMNVGYEFPTEWTKKYLSLSYVALNGYLEDLFYKSTIKRERGTDYPFARKFSISLTVRL